MLTNRIIPCLIMAAMATSAWCIGIPVAMVQLTPTAIFLALAALLTGLTRLAREAPLFPIEALKKPAVWTAAIYFTIGLTTYFQAGDKGLYLKEIIQRTILIWVPMYCTSVGLRSLDQVKSFLLWYLPAGALISIISTGTAISGGFATPVYLLGLHKNMIAGLCGTMCLITIGHLLTSQRAKVKLLKWQVPNKPFYWGLTALGFLGIVAAQGRGGLVEVACGTFIMLIAIRARATTLLKTAGLCVMVLVALYYLMPKSAIEHVVSMQAHGANAVRLQLWGDMWAHFQREPFSACGWGNPYIDPVTGWWYYDLACILLFDWMQMGMIGAIALLVMMFFSLKLGFDNAKEVDPHTMVGFVNTTGLGIAAGKFAHGMLDTFWIGRGHMFHVWTSIGVCLFVHLYLQQQSYQKMRASRASKARVRVGAA